MTHRFKLDDIEAAYELFAHQRDGVMKVAITPEGAWGRQPGARMLMPSHSNRRRCTGRYMDAWFVHFASLAAAEDFVHRLRSTAGHTSSWPSVAAPRGTTGSAPALIRTGGYG